MPIMVGWLWLVMYVLVGWLVGLLWLLEFGWLVSSGSILNPDTHKCYCQSFSRHRELDFKIFNDCLEYPTITILKILIILFI